MVHEEPSENHVKELYEQVRATRHKLYNSALLDLDTLVQLANQERDLRNEFRQGYIQLIEAVPPAWLVPLNEIERATLACISAFYLPFNIEDVAALLACNQIEAEQVCDTLFGYGLLSQEELTGEYEVEAHIWQAATGLLSAADWRATHSWLADYYLHQAHLDLDAPDARQAALLHSAVIDGFAPEAALALVDHLEAAERWSEQVRIANLCFQLRSLCGAQMLLPVYVRAFSVAKTYLPDDFSAHSQMLNCLGLVQRELGNYTAAQAALSECVTVCRSMHDAASEAAALANLGQLAEQMGDLEHAIAYQEQALEIAEHEGSRQSTGVILSDLAALAQQHGDYKAAHAYYERSLAIRHELADSIGAAYVLHQLGSVTALQAQQGRQHLLENAKEYVQESLGILRQANAAPEIAPPLLTLGRIEYMRGDHTAARAAFIEVLERSRTLGLSDVLLEALTNLGQIASTAGEYQAAFTYYNEAAITAVNLDHPNAGIYYLLRDQAAERLG